MAKTQRLAASFFFFRLSEERRSFKHFAPTLASQIAASFPGAEEYAWNAVRVNPAIVSDPDISQDHQLEQLVFEPIRAAIFNNPPPSPLVIVIDGLDECDELEAVGDFIDHLISFLQDSPGLPLRIFIASRVEEDIHARLQHREVNLCNLADYTPERDIRTFLNAEFTRAAKRSRVIRSYGDWPDASDVERLVQHIGGSFIVASTLVKYILGPSEDGLTPIDRLPLAFRLDPGLDGIYTDTLSRSEHLHHFVDIISTIVLLQEPVSVYILALILDLKPFEVNRVLVNLQAIIQIGEDDHGVVALYHGSLYEYLRHEERSGRFFVSPSYHLNLWKRTVAIRDQIFTQFGSPLNRAHAALQGPNGWRDFHLHQWWRHEWEKNKIDIDGNPKGDFKQLEHALKHLSVELPNTFDIIKPLYILLETEVLEHAVQGVENTHFLQYMHSTGALMSILTRTVPTYDCRYFAETLGTIFSYPLMTDFLVHSPLGNESRAFVLQTEDPSTLASHHIEIARGLAEGLLDSTLSTTLQAPYGLQYTTW